MAPTTVIPRNNALRRTQRVTRGRFRTPSVRVPRGLGWRGNCEFTRTTTIALPSTAGLGWTIGASSFPALCAVFDPTGVSLFGSTVSFIGAALPNASEIAAFWDDVFIYKVEVTIDHYNDPATSGQFTGMPRMLVCNDHNDGQAGTTIQRIQQHSDCEIVTSRSKTWTCYPKHQRLIYYNAVTSSYEPARGFVTAGTAIPHYGVHMGILDAAAILDGRTTFNFKYFMRARHTK